MVVLDIKTINESLKSHYCIKLGVSLIVWEENRENEQSFENSEKVINESNNFHKM